jgi:hypothetical protein
MTFPPRLPPVAITVVVAVLLLSGTTPHASPPPAPPAQPAPLPAAAPPAEPAALAEPLSLLADARHAWARVDDYTCVLVRRERVGDCLHPEEVMLMKVRREPFSVYLRWAAPSAAEGQEACYVAGRHDGKMRVRAGGLLGAVGFVSLATDDRRARASSRHTITEAGLGHLIDRLGREWEAGRIRPARVSVADAECDGRPCRRVEVMWPDGAAARCVTHFDRETHLPVRAEWYERDELREADTYTKVRLNVGLGDGDFDY